MMPEESLRKGRHARSASPDAIVERGSVVASLTEALDETAIGQAILEFCAIIAKSATNGSLDIPKSELDAAEAVEALRGRRTSRDIQKIAGQVNELTKKSVDRKKAKEQLGAGLPTRLSNWK